MQNRMHPFWSHMQQADTCSRCFSIAQIEATGCGWLSCEGLVKSRLINASGLAEALSVMRLLEIGLGIGARRYDAVVVQLGVRGEVVGLDVLHAHCVTTGRADRA